MTCIPASWTLKRVDCSNNTELELIDTVTGNTDPQYSKQLAPTQLIDSVTAKTQLSTKKVLTDLDESTVYKDNVVLKEELCVTSGVAPAHNNYKDAVLALSPSNYYKLDEVSGTAIVDQMGGTSGTYFATPTLNQAGLTNDTDNASVLFELGEYGVQPVIANIKAVALSFKLVSNETFIAAAGAFNSSSDRWIILATSGTGFIGIHTTANTTVNSDVTPVIGTTYHVVVSYDGIVTNMYIDGVLQTNTYADNLFDFINEEVSIGMYRSSWTPTAQGNKYIDEVAFFTTALNQSDATTLYNASVSVSTETLCGPEHLLDVVSTRQVMLTHSPTPVQMHLEDYITYKDPIHYINSLLVEDNLGLFLNQAIQTPEGVIVSLTDYVNETFTLTGLFIPQSFFFNLADAVNTVFTLTSFEAGSLVSLADIINTSEAMSEGRLQYLLDTITLAGNIKLANWMIHREDTLSIVDTLVLGYLKELTETLSSTDTVTLSYHIMELLQVLAKIHWIEDISLEDTCEIIDEVFSILSDTLNDSIDIELTSVIILAQDLLDELSLGNAVVFIRRSDLLDTIEVVEDLDALGIYNMLLSDQISLEVFLLDKGSIVAYVLNPRLKGMTTYSNWNFNSYTRTGNKTYATNDTGVYEITGPDDEGDYIDSYMRFAQMSFGTTEMKALEQAYISMGGNGNIVLTIEDQYGTKVYYDFAVRDNLHMNRIKLPRGLISKYFTFELMDSESTEFDLDSLELQPIQLSRKLR